MGKNDTRLDARLSKNEKAMFARLAQAVGKTMSAILRYWIRNTKPNDLNGKVDDE